jgi:methylthioribose-1-phosphate isomerase
MKVGGSDYRCIWIDSSDTGTVKIIDQEKLPFSFEIKNLRTSQDVFTAIKNLTVRGAPAIGAAGAYGIYLAATELCNESSFSERLAEKAEWLASCRPTAVNLRWAIDRVIKVCADSLTHEETVNAAFREAEAIADEEVNNCRKIGENGLGLIKEISNRKGGDPVNILTHCNAGWLACVDYGTVLSPVYLAHRNGIRVHVWVDETRPRNQGARLTAFELAGEGVPHTLITDNAGGHLMQHGLVDIVIAGCDRATSTGDVANKIGTYLKALAAADNNVPFYIALPSSSIDFKIKDGLKEIEVEERDSNEVRYVTGIAEGKITDVRICPEQTKASNFGFDITPARLISGLITEKGVCKATQNDIKELFSEKF